MNKQPLARRIVIAFTLMTLLVSGIFSLGIVATVHFVEDHLVSQEMDRELNVAVLEDLAHGKAPRLDITTQLFAEHIPGYEIPDEFNTDEEGFRELVNGNDAYYIYMKRIDGDKYILLHEQHEFEQRENALFNIVLAGFALSVLSAFILGFSMARKIMAPVRRLASQVRHRDQLLPLAPPLAPEYADDEIGHLAAAFDSTLNQLRESLKREQLFTGDVSHELRTPLMVIAGACELLNETELSHKQRTQLERINRASHDMSALVQTFLLLARGKKEIASDDNQALLSEVLQQQVGHWQPEFTKKTISLQVTIQNPSQQSYNHVLLSSVINNLLRNALHYTEQGYVSLTIDGAQLIVRDSGIGVAPEIQKTLFMPFVRGSNARGEGLGLGLSLVRRICELQGWTIRVEDNPPQGSCFILEL